MRALIITLISSVIFVVAAVVLLAVVRSRPRRGLGRGRTAGRDRVLGPREARTARSARTSTARSTASATGWASSSIGAASSACWRPSLSRSSPGPSSSIVALRVHRACPRTSSARREVSRVYALVDVITIIPIAPGGAGIPELLYIAGLSAIAGEPWEAAITAGVFLFRLYQWFLPIPLAWILLKVARRGRPMLPTARPSSRPYAVDGRPDAAMPAPAGTAPTTDRRRAAPAGPGAIRRSCRTGSAATRTCSRCSSPRVVGRASALFLSAGSRPVLAPLGLGLFLAALAAPLFAWLERPGPVGRRWR